MPVERTEARVVLIQDRMWHSVIVKEQSYPMPVAQEIPTELFAPGIFKKKYHLTNMSGAFESICAIKSVSLMEHAKAKPRVSAMTRATTYEEILNLKRQKTESESGDRKSVV